MEKTKLNLSVALVAAVAWLLGLYGGYVITGILIGYVLLREDSLVLKKACLRVLALMLAFSVAFTVINLVPNLLDLVYNFLRLFNVNFYLDFVHRGFDLLYSIVSLCKTVVFVLMAVLAVLNKDIKIPVLDPILDKILA